MVSILQKAEIVTKEKNRASAIEMKPEIRRTKARLSEEVPKLQRLAIKRVSFLFSSWTTYIDFLAWLSLYYMILFFNSSVSEFH